MMLNISPKRILSKLLTPEDIILLKCATQREGDLFDVKAIMQLSSALNWDVLVDEVIQQAKKITYGPYRLHDFLSRFEEKHKIEVPMKVFEKLEKWIALNSEKKNQKSIS